MVQQKLPLKYEEKVGNENKTFKKIFITRMSVPSISSMMLQSNEAQIEVIKPMGFASFLKVDLKQILGKFSNFDPYAICFELPDGKKFLVTLFDIHMMPLFNLGLGLSQLKSQSPIVMSMSIADADIGGERDEHHEEVVQDHPKQESKKDDSTPSFSLGLGLSQLDSQSSFAASTSILDQKTISEKDDDHQEEVVKDQANLGLVLSQPDNQSLAPTSKFAPDTKITGEKDDDHEDGDVASLRSSLRDSTQANRDLTIKKVPGNKSKVGKKRLLKRLRCKRRPLR
ncbi:hypothetical protein Cgig2_000550 [Carnegiea gigantea]|uniref:Uncharacterized protein n=1 Tax=Carnegiea gigantea TaxID=171969 RepID=A0A9Q1GRT9_9CARY|nr:hypothetical protein Cgig2_000550 [Carnegiea gigantea]